MTERACICQHDRTTANGVVLDGLDDIGLDDRKLSYLGARVQCPACNVVGHIEAAVARSLDDDLGGKQHALEGDLCRCACNPPPRLVASQRDWTVE
ncbi:PAAR domain-containing protein [Burkholderia sp. Bp9017]|uniref:PAAR domain-containing protein n=1 Tax=Burkholderia TaxID=32008 RepID=UPI000F5F17CA|nr:MULTISPECIES: PAAR domain-containing protein [Burkholderia]MBY4868142.1 PAAR domain-containing protein [Burkholderia anthina]RQZ21367.1 PAAR domain-containing protein [Burkholderia sp. Bp9017]